MSGAQSVNLGNVITPVLTIEERIKQELGDEFVRIASCESTLKQFNDDGTVLISHTNDKGLFQVNHIHWNDAIRLGIDLDTIDGQIAYAKHLKEKNGTKDWFMSKKCWNI